MLATLTDVAITAPIALLVGIAIGFVATDRYRIVKRELPIEPDATTYRRSEARHRAP